MFIVQCIDLDFRSKEKPILLLLLRSGYVAESRNRNIMFGGLGLAFLGYHGLIRFWVSVVARVRVNSVRDSFSVLLRAQHYTMLMTFVSATTALLLFCDVYDRT